MNPRLCRAVQYWLRKSVQQLFKVGADMYTGDEDNGSMVQFALLLLVLLCCCLRRL